MTIEHDYWKGRERDEVRFLDGIDEGWWKEYVIKPGLSIYQIECIIGDVWGEEYEKCNGDELFTWISEGELQEYIEKRFNKRFREISYMVLA